MDPELVDVFCFESERNAGREALAADELDRARSYWSAPWLGGRARCSPASRSGRSSPREPSLPKRSGCWPWSYSPTSS
ncbi:hypothetical protein NKG94_36335 [Micromonospora sp. M12]